MNREGFIGVRTHVECETSSGITRKDAPPGGLRIAAMR